MSNKKINIGVTNKEGQLGFLFSKGGLREGAGRKNIGMTKKISLTLPSEVWESMEMQCTDKKQSRSEVIRNILESFYTK